MTTPNYKLNELIPGQVGKEYALNYNSYIVDALLTALSTANFNVNIAPASPSVGAVHIIGPTPTGIWAAYARHIAIYTSNGWLYIIPTANQAIAAVAGGSYIYNGNDWSLINPGGGGAIAVRDEGSTLTTSATALNFTGAGVTASGTGEITISVPGATTSTFTTQDEGTPLSSTVTTLNFVGAGVTATGAGSTTTVTVPGSSALTTQEEGVSLSTSVNTLNFTGAGVTATGTGAVTTINIPGAGTATITTQDEGTNLSTTVNTLNFVGAGVTATGTGNTTTVTISGSGGAQLNAANTWTKSQSVLIQSISYASTIVLDGSLSNSFRIVLTGNPTIAFSNIIDGQTINLDLIHSGAARTVTWDSASTDFSADSSPPTLSNAASKKDILTFICNSTKAQFVGLKGGFAA